MSIKAPHFFAKIKKRTPLTQTNSTKETYHVVLTLETANIDSVFHVGDSLAILPQNDPAITNKIIELLKATGEELIFDKRVNEKCSFREFLLKKANLCKCTSSMLKQWIEHGVESELILHLINPEHKSKLAEFHIIDLLASNSPLSPQELCSTLLPLMPRFYSIASSPHVFPQEIHLTVASRNYTRHGNTRHGVGSYFLNHLATEATQIACYIQPSNGFTLPTDPSTSIILIGPGTGVAPFRAFLQERMALQHKGRNWLFFGERNQATDFYYSEYWLWLEKQGHLRLNLAFSRDQEEKIYVQHLLWEQKESLWDWIQTGAFIYVCGDAENMAKDVDCTLQKIGCDLGKMTQEESREWLKTLRRNKRYLQDVY